MTSNVVFCVNAVNTSSLPDVPKGMVAMPNGQIVPQDLSLPLAERNESVGLVRLSSGELQDVMKLPKREMVHLEREFGNCVILSKGEAIAASVTQAAIYLLIGIVFTYIFTRVRVYKDSVIKLQLQASFLLAGLFFLVGTTGLFLGINGAVEFSLNQLTINTAIPSLILFVFAWLIWRGAMKKMSSATVDSA